MTGLVVFLWLLCGYILALVGDKMVFGRSRSDSYVSATLGAVMGPMMLIPLSVAMIIGHYRR